MMKGSLIFAAGLFVVLAAAYGIWFCLTRRVPDKHLIPNGYVGYITVFYDEPKAKDHVCVCVG